MSNNVDLSLLGPILKKYQSQEGALITMLQELQKAYGYLPEVVLTHLSQEVKVPLSQIYGVVTFYAQFYLTPRGRNIIRVCRGTACHVRGGSRILEAVEREVGIMEGETTPDLEYSLETVACIGACALAPTMVINEKTYGKLTSKKVMESISRRDRREREVE